GPRLLRVVAEDGIRRRHEVPVLLVRGEDAHEALGLGHGERAEEDAVHRADHDGSRAEAEAQDEHGRARESRHAREGARGETEVGEEAHRAHSVLSAAMGSKRAARTAGTREAASAVAPRRAVAAASVAGSTGLTANRRLPTTRASANVAASPAAIPHAASA